MKNYAIIPPERQIKWWAPASRLLLGFIIALALIIAVNKAMQWIEQHVIENIEVRQGNDGIYIGYKYQIYKHQ